MVVSTSGQDGTQGKGTVATSGGAEGTQSEETPTLTRAQGEKMVSDALSSAGRDAKALDDGRRVLDTDRASHDSSVLAFQERMDAAEDATHKDNPDMVAILQSKRSLDRREEVLKRSERETTARETALTEREKTATAAQRGISAAKIAHEVSVAIEPLLNHTDGTEEGMRDLAEHLTKTGAGSTGEGGDGSPAPDSGLTSGGVEVTTDNIDLLHSEGKVSDDKYRAFLRTGQLQ